MYSFMKGKFKILLSAVLVSGAMYGQVVDEPLRVVQRIGEKLIRETPFQISFGSSTGRFSV